VHAKHLAFCLAEHPFMHEAVVLLTLHACSCCLADPACLQLLRLLKMADASGYPLLVATQEPVSADNEPLGTNAQQLRLMYGCWHGRTMAVCLHCAMAVRGRRRLHCSVTNSQDTSLDPSPIVGRTCARWTCLRTAPALIWR